MLNFIVQKNKAHIRNNYGYLTLNCMVCILMLGRNFTMNNQKSNQASTNPVLNSYTAASSNTAQTFGTNMNPVNATNAASKQSSNQTIIGVFASRSY